MNRPIFLSKFIGRKNELGRLESLIRNRSTRLLTLTGPGGCGKTRLANEVLANVSETFEDGFSWLDLAEVSHPDALLQTVIASLEIRPAPGQSPLTALSSTLREREILLVLDNCEHLVEACANLIDSLLRACPELHVLATSRQKLEVEGEQVWAVPPLSYPANKILSLSSLDDFDALHLFFERARLVYPGFEINAQNLPALVKIAQLLEGMPLAIELAAARMNVLDVFQLAKQLDGQLSLLSGRGHTAVSRHYSMSETIHWSYELLSPLEKILFYRLGVFAGGFSLEAVIFVCSDARLEESNIVDLLGRLIDKSLVVRIAGQQSDARYRLLESIRQFAAEKLFESGEGDLLQDRHLEYFLNLVHELEPHFLGPAQKQSTERLRMDHDNLQTALSRTIQKALKNGRFILEAVQMANGLYWFWNYSGRHEQARNHYARVLELPELDLDAPYYAELKHHLATFTWLLGDYLGARVHLHDCYQIAQSANYPFGVAHAKLLLGIMSLHQGQADQAIMLLQESERLFNSLSDSRGLVITFANLGGVFLTNGDLASARNYAEKAVLNARASQDLWGLGLSLSGLGAVLHRQGDVKRALVLMEEALLVIQSSGQQWLQAEALWRFASMRLDLEDLEGAQKGFEQCYDVAQESGAMEWQLSALNSLGFLLLRQGLDPQAAAHFSEILQLTQGQRYEPVFIHTLLGVVHLAIKNQQWARAVSLWDAFMTSKKAHRMPSFTEEGPISKSLRSHLEASQRLQPSATVRAYSLMEVTGLAMEILKGFDQSIIVLPSTYRLRILGLGSTEVYLNGKMLTAADWTFAKPKELLYYLASNSPKTKEQIGLVFWPDASPSSLRVSLRATLYQLRRALGERSWILYEDGYYKFNRSKDYWYDVEAFEEGIETAKREAAYSKSAAIDRLEEVRSCYRGEFLSGLANDEWGVFRREELRNKYFESMGLLGMLLIDSQSYDRAIEHYRTLLSLDNLLEEVHRELMRCYALKGDRVLALRQYQTLVEVMRDEMGVPPSLETTRLFQSIQNNSF